MKRTEPFGTVRVGAAQPSVAVVPERLREIPPLAELDAPPNRTVNMSVAPSLRRGLDFLVNGERHHQDSPVRVGWMYHCHILEHHEAGMMGHFEVVREGSTTDRHAHGHAHHHAHH